MTDSSVLDALLDYPPELSDAPSWARLLYAQSVIMAGKIGNEPDASGSGGTGLTGKIANLERRLAPFESLKDKAWGAAAMAGLLLAALFWILQDKFAALFRVH